ncbi:hypothetical protein [Desulfobulbus oligotrophicus]|uniref:Uncharacterized protein n=1 Tax=Desulfobulbus oligotrophicus TaxID=1909699 RepID=A0A7T5VC50_9BACT|nr:hypothetical protein [Desulfobulbus oligotrophicus]QQG65174.1 hypothetical protein HP555_04465 [Desulfobulbus oligotrophicus]
MTLSPEGVGRDAATGSGKVDKSSLIVAHWQTDSMDLSDAHPDYIGKPAKNTVCVRAVVLLFSWEAEQNKGRTIPMM